MLLLVIRNLTIVGLLFILARYVWALKINGIKNNFENALAVIPKYSTFYGVSEVQD